MKISEMIDELKERLEYYGDMDVVFRDYDSDFGDRICSVYVDHDEDVCVVSNFIIPERFRRIHMEIPVQLDLIITKEKIREGIDKGVIRFIADPNADGGTVCAIGDNWFYFGGLTAEELDPDEYVKCIPIDTIVQEIYDVLDDFVNNEGFRDEYVYYSLVLNGE